MVDHVENGTEADDERRASGIRGPQDRYVASLHGGNHPFDPFVLRYLALGGVGGDSLTMTVIPAPNVHAANHNARGDDGAGHLTAQAATGHGRSAFPDGGGDAGEFTDDRFVGSGILGGSNAFTGRSIFDVVRQGGLAVDNVSLAAGTGSDGTAANNTYSGIEGFHGSDAGDTPGGNNADSVLVGQGGADTLTGEGGADLLTGSTRCVEFLRRRAGEGSSGSVNPFGQPLGQPAQQRRRRRVGRRQCDRQPWTATWATRCSSEAAAPTASTAAGATTGRATPTRTKA